MPRAIIGVLCVGLLGVHAGQTLWAKDRTVVNRLPGPACVQCHDSGHSLDEVDSLLDEGFQEIDAEMSEIQGRRPPNPISDHQAAEPNRRLTELSR